MWDVDGAAALLDRQPRQGGPSLRRRAAGRAELERAGAYRLDVPARAGRRGRVAAQRLPLPRLRDGRGAADRRSRARRSAAPASTTARSTARAASSPATWTTRRREPLGRPLPARPRPDGDAARERHHRSQRPLLEPRRPRPSISPTPGRGASAPTTTTSPPATSLSRRVFADFEGHLRGYPDGATVDAEGFVWSAEVYGGRLVRFAPDGTIDRLVGMPVDSTTSIMLRRRRPRHRLRHLDGAAVQRPAPAGARGRRPLRGPRAGRARRARAALQG